MADDADGSDDGLHGPYKHVDPSPNGANGGAGPGRRLTEEEARQCDHELLERKRASVGLQSLTPEQIRKWGLEGTRWEGEA